MISPSFSRFIAPEMASGFIMHLYYENYATATLINLKSGYIILGHRIELL